MKALIIILLMASMVQAEQNIWLVDQTGMFGETIQVYRNYTSNTTWYKQVNISEGIFTVDGPNTTYVIQLEADKSVTMMDATNPNWSAYQILAILSFVGTWFLFGVFMLIIVIYVSGGAYRWLIGN